MKKIFVTLIVSFCFITLGKSQASFGAGITYLNDLGVQLRSSIVLSSFDFIPKFSYYIVDDVTSLSLELDGALDIVHFGEENPLYVFGGPAIYRASSNGVSDTNLAITIGAGLQIEHIYGELKYGNLFCEGCDGQIGFAAGYMF